MNKIKQKIELYRLMEWENLLKRLKVKAKDDYPQEELGLKRLIVNHEHKFIYCPINKNASSSLLKSIATMNFLAEGKQAPQFSRNTYHIYCLLNYSLANYTYDEASKIIESDYFKFAIVRNPWARLVSTYANFFIRLLSSGRVSQLARDTAKFFYGEQKYLEYEDKITFEQLVEYVCAVDNKSLDPHCKPQSLFLGDIKYDFLGRMENLNNDLEQIQKRLNCSFDIPKLNRTNYEDSSQSVENFSSFSSQQLRKSINKVPNYKQFYNSKLIDMVADKYAQDITRFGYEF